MREVWIEIFSAKSSPVYEVWIEINRDFYVFGNHWSLPVREVWIEICTLLNISRRVSCHFP